MAVNEGPKLPGSVSSPASTGAAESQAQARSAVLPRQRPRREERPQEDLWEAATCCPASEAQVPETTRTVLQEEAKEAQTGTHKVKLSVRPTKWGGNTRVRGGQERHSQD